MNYPIRTALKLSLLLISFFCFYFFSYSPQVFSQSYIEKNLDIIPLITDSSNQKVVVSNLDAELKLIPTMYFGSTKINLPCIHRLDVLSSEFDQKDLPPKLSYLADGVFDGVKYQLRVHDCIQAISYPINQDNSSYELKTIKMTGDFLTDAVNIIEYTKKTANLELDFMIIDVLRFGFFDFQLESVPIYLYLETNNDQ